MGILRKAMGFSVRLVRRLPRIVAGQRFALLLLLAGGTLAAIGTGEIYAPAGLIIAGGWAAGIALLFDFEAL
jgi:hypothetical protein